MNNFNKFEVLIKAQNYGVLVPDSIITNKISELKAFYLKHNKKLITKPISDITFYKENDFLYNFKTNFLDESIFEKNSSKLFPSLFQEYIEKEYEIRSFFLDNKFYSMCIFSQSNKKTMIDFRNYDEEKPNRTVPFIIPIELQNKLSALLQHLNLSSGSIDLIKEKNTNRFVFLEVNPVGQYGMTSIPCNYYLDKLIAEHLIKLTNNEE